MCGIVGVISTSPVNQLIYDALLLLQHRGQAFWRQQDFATGQGIVDYLRGLALIECAFAEEEAIGGSEMVDRLAHAVLSFDPQATRTILPKWALAFMCASAAAASDRGKVLSIGRLSLPFSGRTLMVAPFIVTATVKRAVGRFAAETLGDYAAGPSHVLPTDGGARTLGGVTTSSFMTTMSVQLVTEAGARQLAPIAAELGCTRLEAFDRQLRARVELMPYLHGKAPVDVNINRRGDMTLVLARAGDVASTVQALALSLSAEDAAEDAAVLASVDCIEQNQGVSQ